MPEVQHLKQKQKLNLDYAGSSSTKVLALMEKTAISLTTSQHPEDQDLPAEATLDLLPDLRMVPREKKMLFEHRTNDR